MIEEKFLFRVKFDFGGVVYVVADHKQIDDEIAAIAVRGYNENVQPSSDIDEDSVVSIEKIQAKTFQRGLS